MRLRLLGALVPVLAVAVILTRGGGGMQGEAKGGKAEPFVVATPFVWHFEPQVEQWMDWTQLVDPSQEPVETWVKNNSACLWDLDDAWRQSGFGDLAAGQQVSIDSCLVNDPNPIWASRLAGGVMVSGWWSNNSARSGVNVVADSSALIVTACFAPQSRCFTLSPTLTNAKTNTYRYAACLDAVYNPSILEPDPDGNQPGAYPSPLVEILGSAGTIRAGYGVLTTATVSATNPTAEIVRNVELTNSVDGLGRNTVCPASSLGAVDEGYPFKSWP
jgi:hypothetical protein